MSIYISCSTSLHNTSACFLIATKVYIVRKQWPLSFGWIESWSQVPGFWLFVSFVLSNQKTSEKDECLERCFLPTCLISFRYLWVVLNNFLARRILSSFYRMGFCQPPSLQPTPKYNKYIIYWWSSLLFQGRASDRNHPRLCYRQLVFQCFHRLVGRVTVFWDGDQVIVLLFISNVFLLATFIEFSSFYSWKMTPLAQKIRRPTNPLLYTDFCSKGIFFNWVVLFWVLRGRFYKLTSQQVKLDVYKTSLASLQCKFYVFRSMPLLLA